MSLAKKFLSGLINYIQAPTTLEISALTMFRTHKRTFHCDLSDAPAKATCNDDVQRRSQDGKAPTISPGGGVELVHVGLAHNFPLCSPSQRVSFGKHLSSHRRHLAQPSHGWRNSISTIQALSSRSTQRGIDSLDDGHCHNYMYDAVLFMLQCFFFVLVLGQSFIFRVISRVHSFA